ncbi:hypothetical protein BB558_003607 [Smittium angustum]|uniref:Oxidoreductase-like domain-containing protein n=1 Tax=Smittium angustum TaxID=133377 RepID=A0A2U1J5L5_SMIAN|nr:hypothetical protein BB558_003607 [Smittium angustum]
MFTKNKKTPFNSPTKNKLHTKHNIHNYTNFRMYSNLCIKEENLMEKNISKQSKKVLESLKELSARFPPKPEPPILEMCCDNDCEVCIWDTFEENVRTYFRDAKQLRILYQMNRMKAPKEFEKNELKIFKESLVFLQSLREFHRIEKLLP